MRHVVFALALLVSAAGGAAAQSPAPPSGGGDVAILEACLLKAKDDAGKDDATACIGKLFEACVAEPGRQDTTRDRQDCAVREQRAWQAIVDGEIEKLSKGALGKTAAEPWNRPREAARKTRVAGAVIIADMQKAFARMRALKCDVVQMQYEGGTAAGVAYAICLYEETGRHALWLRDYRTELDAR